MKTNHPVEPTADDRGESSPHEVALAHLAFGTAWVALLYAVLAWWLAVDPPVPNVVLGTGAAFAVVSAGYVYVTTARRDARVRRERDALRASRNWFESLTVATPVPVIAVDTEGTVELWNDAAERVFGWTADEVVGRPLPTVPPAREGEADRLIERTLAGDSLDGVDVRRQDADGELRDLSLSTEPIRDAEGEAVGVMGTLVDVTEARERERRLREFEMAVEQAGHAIYLTDEEGVITYVNPAFEEVTGYGRDDAVGETPNILNSGEMSDSYFERLWTTITSGHVWRERVTDQRKTGERYTASQTIAPITDGDSVEGYVAIQTDITETEITKQRLSVLNRVLRHNLRNEMNVIEGYADLIAETCDDPAVREQTALVTQSASELESLAEKVRAAGAALQTEPYETPLGTLVDEVTGWFGERYPDARLDVTVAAERHASVDGRLAVAVQELVENSVEHGEGDTPTVALSVRPTDGAESHVVFTVTDDGPGIPEYELDAVQRDAEDSLVHGTGVGLWLVRWVVTNAGGTLDVESTPGAGSTVAIEVPVVE
jgi:PAS domain S-box-containing protein